MSSLRSARAVLLRVNPWQGGEVHGGLLRSRQLAELVRAALPDIVEINADHWRAASGPVLARLAARGQVLALRWRTTPVEGLFSAWIESLLAPLALSPGDLVIYDADPRFGPALVRVCSHRRLRIVAMPHNIEAVLPKKWPIVVDFDTALRQLRDELAWLARADAVFCIGTLDRDLLQLFGIQAELLPYAPPEGRRAELLAIRARRNASPPASGLLILGTAHNQPTRAGMLEQLAMLRALTASTAPPVTLAGYGTDLIADASVPGVRFAGPQSWPDLQNLIAGAGALWVHQTPMSGALTRITEALVAGLPVIANHWGARGHTAMAGMTVYDGQPDLPGLLAACPVEFDVPDCSTAEKLFADHLRDDRAGPSPAA